MVACNRPGLGSIEKGEEMHASRSAYPGTDIDLSPLSLADEIVDVHMERLAELEAVFPGDRGESFTFRY